MHSLYKNLLFFKDYWECWNTENNSVIIHWGKVGHRGQSKEIQFESKSACEAFMQSEIKKQIFVGYHYFDEDKMKYLIIEYPIENWGDDNDQKMLIEAENEINQLLGWTGLGYCDGHSFGEESMEITCLVINYSKAKRIIKKHLDASKFNNYNSIYKEGFSIKMLNPVFLFKILKYRFKKDE